MHCRMGDNVQPDLALSMPVTLDLMAGFERDWAMAGGSRDQQKAVIFPALFCVAAFAGGLRGDEVPLLDLAAARADGLDRTI